MSKPSTTSTPKISTQLPQKSAWARGPPQTSTSPAVTSTSASPTRSQSPALPPPQNATNSPVQTHSRRSSAFGQKGVTIKDGINIPSRGHVGTSKQSMSRLIGIDSILWRPSGARPLRLHAARAAWDSSCATSPFLCVSNISSPSRFGHFWINRRQFRDDIFISRQCAPHKSRGR